MPYGAYGGAYNRNTTNPNFAFLPIAAGGASLLSGLFGGQKDRPMMDLGFLQRNFGPQALSNETQQLYRFLLNSPAFSQMMNSAAMQGTRTANATQAGLARSGVSATPLGGFLKAAGRGYGATLQRGGQQELFMQALQAAMQNLQNRQNLYGQSFLAQQQSPQIPSFLQNLAGVFGSAAGQGFAKQ